MQHVHTSVLRYPAAGWPDGWKLAFQVFSKPINLIIAMRERLTTDYRSRIPNFWIHDLHSYNKLMSIATREMDETLEVLDTLGAYKSWDVGHRIRTAITPAYSRLAHVGDVSRGRVYTDAEISSIRHRVFEETKQFSERPLLEDLRKAISEEVHIKVERRWLDAGDEYAHYGIVAPDAFVQETGPGETPDTDGADQLRKMTWQEARDRLERLRTQGEPFSSQSTLAQQLGCSPSTINKAISKTESLQTWAKPESISAPMAQSFNEVVVERKAQSRELDPQEDAAIREYLEKDLAPEERAFFHSLSIGNQLDFLNDPDKHQRILGRKP